MEFPIKNVPFSGPEIKKVISDFLGRLAKTYAQKHNHLTTFKVGPIKEASFRSDSVLVCKLWLLDLTSEENSTLSLIHAGGFMISNDKDPWGELWIKDLTAEIKVSKG